MATQSSGLTHGDYLYGDGLPWPAHKSRKEDVSPAPEVMACQEALNGGWCLVDQGGNGDCGYRALANAFHVQSNGGQADALWLRHQVVLHVQKHADRFGDFLAKDVDTAPEDKSPTENIQEWLHKAGEQGTWIDGVALQAISEKRGTPLVVFKVDSVTI
eukprot:s7554_g2.t1